MTQLLFFINNQLFLIRRYYLVGKLYNSVTHIIGRHHSHLVAKA